MTSGISEKDSLQHFLNGGYVHAEQKDKFINLFITKDFLCKIQYFSVILNCFC